MGGALNHIEQVHELHLASTKGRCILPMEIEVWQSRVEIEHYSIAYFNCITMFEL